MSGSGASNLGYGQITPLSNINGQLVNVHNTNNPANFSSNEIPGLPGLAGAKSNIDAAAGIVPGICLLKGGAKKLKRKIKNITRKYKKMGKNGRKLKSVKNTVKNLMSSRSAMRSFAGGRRKKRGTRRRTRRVRRQRGGYAQYQNNQPFDNSYSVGGVLSASDSALANPAPINTVTNNAIDNYNHYSNTGFPSKGH